MFRSTFWNRAGSHPMPSNPTIFLCRDESEAVKNCYQANPGQTLRKVFFWPHVRYRYLLAEHTGAHRRYCFRYVPVPICWTGYRFLPSLLLEAYWTYISLKVCEKSFYLRPNNSTVGRETSCFRCGDVVRTFTSCVAGARRDISQSGAWRGGAVEPRPLPPLTLPQ